MDFSNYLQPGIGVVAGGLGTAFVTYVLQEKRAKRDLAITLAKEFSSSDAHELRAHFWELATGQTIASFEDADLLASSNQDQLGAFRYVLGYFVQASVLLRNGRLNEGLFFDLSERWLREIFDNHLTKWASKDHSAHYAVQKDAIEYLQKRRQRWQPWKKWLPW